MQITVNSWDCLLIEDAEKNQITGINSLVVVVGQLSVLFAPISAVLFFRLTLVAVIRILYLNAFAVMTLKAAVLYIFSRETKMGVIRMRETHGKNIFQLAMGYGGVFRIIVKSRGTIFALIITALVGIVGMINTTFWQVIVSRKLLVPDHLLPLFPILKSIITIIFLFAVAPRFSVYFLKRPLLACFACYIAGQTLLIFAPPEGAVKYAALCVSLVFDSFGQGSLFMLAKSLVALNVNPAERARVQAILHMTVMAVTVPFGWIGGLLSEISRNFPFVMNLCLLTLGICITLLYYKGASVPAKPAARG
jgi:hypothetical protein